MKNLKSIQLIFLVCSTMVGCVIEAPPAEDGGGGSAASAGFGGMGGMAGNGGTGGTNIRCDQPDPITCANAGCFWSREGCGSDEPEACVGLDVDLCTTDASCTWRHGACEAATTHTTCDLLDDGACQLRSDCFPVYANQDDCDCGTGEASGSDQDGDAERFAAPIACQCEPLFEGCEPMDCDGRHADWCEVDDRCVVITETTCGEPPAQAEPRQAPSDESTGALEECFGVEVDVCRPVVDCGRIVGPSDCGARPNCRWGARPECRCDEADGVEGAGGSDEPEESEADAAPIMAPVECDQDCYVCLPSQPRSVCEDLDYFQCDGQALCQWLEASEADPAPDEADSGSSGERQSAAPAQLPPGSCRQR